MIANWLREHSKDISVGKIRVLALDECHLTGGDICGRGQGDRQPQEGVSLPSSSWQEIQPEDTQDSAIVEAQKWIVNDKGNVVLVAGTPVSSAISDRNCHTDNE